MAYIIRAYDHAGNIGYYTGKAGSEWVNNQSYNAFSYVDRVYAEARAEQFNQMTQIHKMLFRVEALD